jgi:hypothetical protein
MLILFSCTAFTAARYFFQEKGALCVFGWFFVAADSGTLAANGLIIEETRSMLDDVNREIARLEGEADFWRTRTWRRYDEFNEQLTAGRERREALRTELTRLEAERPALMEEAAVSRETVYSFLARLLKLPEDAARFFIYVVPACLYDVLAPFALSVVLMLEDKRKSTGGRN